jgi:hypothetical protein
VSSHERTVAHTRVYGVIKMVKKVSLIVIMLAFLSLIIPFNACMYACFNTVYAEGTTVQVSPQTSAVEMGTTFTVNVTVTAVADLAVWEVQLYYLNTILNCTGAQEGPFLNQVNGTFFASNIKNAYNATHGWLLCGSTLVGPAPGVTGSGTLVTITFQAKTAGETALHLEGTTLKDSTPPPRNPIAHTAIDGVVHVIAHPKMKVDPETYTVQGIGKTFTINITAVEVTDLWGWDFKLFYDSLQLNGTAVEEGPFLQTAGETLFWEVNFTDNYNATHGYAYAFCALTHVIPGANGNGTLATITFKAKTCGGSILDLTDTKMKDSEGDYISHETKDGSITVASYLGDLGTGPPPTFFAFDGVIDAFDFALWKACYDGLAPPNAMYLADLGTGPPPTFFAFDGVIDAFDFALWKACYDGLGPDP